MANILLDYSPEDFEKEVLCLNGRMTQELFDKVMNELFEKESLDSDDVFYRSNEYNTTLEEFQDVHNYLHEYGLQFKFIKTGCQEILFWYKNRFFIWILILGQGAHEELTTDVATFLDLNPIMPFIVCNKVKEDLKFYKRLKDE